MLTDLGSNKNLIKLATFQKYKPQSHEESNIVCEVMNTIFHLNRAKDVNYLVLVHISLVLISKFLNWYSPSKKRLLHVAIYNANYISKFATIQNQSYLPFMFNFR